MIVDTIAAFGRSSGIYGFMNSTWGWPFIESLHYFALAILLGTVGLFDLRMLGVARGISLAALHKLVPFGVGAYVANIITGSMFFVSAPDQYLYNPAFQLKLASMMVAGINAAIFYTTTASAVKNSGAEAAVPVRAKIIAVVSLTCWMGVITFGRLITYFRPPYEWCFWC